MAKKQRIGITCWCDSYKFPHRLSGGKCSGAKWAQAYFYTVRQECVYCVANRGSYCEVATCQESIHECLAMIEENRQ